MKGQVKILDSNGHTPLFYDTERPEGYTEDDKVFESMEVIKERVRRAREEQGKRLFKVNDQKKGELIDGEYKPEEHDQVLLVPPIAGGC